MKKLTDLEKKAALVRKWCLVSTSQAACGHPTSCLSAADLTTVLFDRFFTYEIKNPKNPHNDRFVLSKGHAAPLLYTLFALSGGLPLEELKTLRKFGSKLEGHPTPRFKFAEVATGSLGQGLSIGSGMAYGIRAGISNFKFQISNLPKVYVLLGDGEMAEGNVWEAANFSSYYNLNNLIAIVDVNGLGQSQETMYGHNLDEYVQRFSAFDWQVIAIDGHNFGQIERAFRLAVDNKSNKPFVIVAKTKKGKGVSFLEGKGGWHGKALKKDELEKALLELGEIDDGLRFSLRSVVSSLRSPFQFGESSNASVPASRHSAGLGIRPAQLGLVKTSPHEKASRDVYSGYNLGDEMATREAYGKVLTEIANEDLSIYALDGDTKNSTFSQEFKKAHPSRFIECFIAEQNMTGVALGLATMGKIPFVSTFATFLTRAFDQIRMAAISRANIKFIGSHAGVSIGEDGPSQMGLEDFAMFGAVPDSVILHPCDATSTAKLLPHLLTHTGISYLRTLRPKTAVIYRPNEKFNIGGSKILRQSRNDVLTVVATGITVYEALKAYEQLKEDGISIRVVDCYCLKPIDRKTIEQCIHATIQPLIITVEDHYEHGGLGDFVLEALSQTGAKVSKMVVSKIPVSGTPSELLDFAGISAKHIVKKVRSFI